ncbi:tail fiber domain-containing protein [Nitratireductor aquimarinus]|uniref:tail fiber domain-containing protein n=1 Tax=Alphaproteobacteria TaxID=28211 RepID=UPI0019D324D2|nr:MULTISPECIES: tail fiber domain-containing protein [Alphaproteobacteria]MBN7758995.1 tail fiber domain-containing protein [Nitratireductor aquimarinus]MBY6001668.1 tail fiber domain-containing protein [Tritonibacter mobilis]MBY6023956.1 tail fiber domain-containing protein [Nitratireductor sp. DP7N14-4]
MSIFSKLGALIFAPTDAAGNSRQVNNHDAQVWSTEVERIIQVALEGGDLLVYSSLSALNADLDHAANTGAILIGESIADDGLYMKQGASGSGSWVKIGNVPGQGFVKATNAGAGTANAIAATTPVAVNETQLILLPITAANTASPVTVAFNGGAALTVKTVSGNDVAAGGLPAGSVMLGVVQGGDFRLLSDQASAGIQAAAEAAQVAAEAALAEMREKSVGAFPDNASADAFLTAEGLTKQKGTIYFNTTADVWRYWDGSAWQTFPYATVADGVVTREKLDADLSPSIAVNIKEHGGNGDGVTDNAAAITAADLGVAVEFPSGVYFTTVVPPYPVFTNGGGAIKIGTETYKLGKVPQVISSYEQTEVDGRTVRYSSYVDGQDAAPSLENDSTSYANIFLGTSSGELVTAAIRATGIGESTLREGVKLYSTTALGTNSLQYCGYGDRLTFIGDNSGKNVGNTDVSERHQYFTTGADTSFFDINWPTWRTWAGSIASPNFEMMVGDYLSKATHCIGIGRNALGYAIVPVDSVAVGYDAATSALDANGVTAVGDRVMQMTLKAFQTTAVGKGALSETLESTNDVAVGINAMSRFVHAEKNVAVGSQALQGAADRAITDTPSGNVAIGRQAMQLVKGDATNNVGIGQQSLVRVTGDNNTSVGASALNNLTSGNGNNAFGQLALSVMQDSSPATSLTNAIGIGNTSRVSGNNQCQLGGSAITTYAYGAVQDRSDERDKADIEDSPLGLDFLLRHRAVQYRWDYREDYVEFISSGEDKDGQPLFEIVRLPKDGSKKRNRKHNGFIAQEVNAICEDMGIDFAGLQHHAKNGGNDVWSLGYAEYIPILVKAIQELEAKVRELQEGASSSPTS